MAGDADSRLIDEALGVVRDAQRRAPADFILALAVVLGSCAVLLLLGAVVTGGFLRDLFLNLGVEVIGAWLTVVLINGLWRRLETGAAEALETMSLKLERRRGTPLSGAEREAWRLFVDEYRALVSAESLPDRLRALPSYGRRMRALEARGNRTLAEFERVASEATPRER